MQIKLTKHEMSFKKSAKQIGANSNEFAIFFLEYSKVQALWSIKNKAYYDKRIMLQWLNQRLK